MEQKLISLNSKEEWRPVEGFPLYSVSSEGRIINVRTGRLLKQVKDKYGYMRLSLNRDGTSHTQKVHRIVAKAFIPNPENKPQVNHISGIKNENKVSNLEWVTNSENILHAYSLGLLNTSPTTGEKHGLSKLTEKEVLLIREMSSQGTGSRELSKTFKISQSTICDIIKRRSWKHL
ncbi:HNH homing endonuclease [Bacillus phage PSYJ-YH]|nr:HNH homing endonuclease [Bacillus phage PSYJ-YH]